MTKWKSKNLEKKDYKETLGQTDYNIPTFSYKSSLFICILSLIVILFIPEIIKDKLISIILSSLLIGLIVSYSQYFIQSNKGISKAFYITSILFALLAFVILFLYEYARVLL